MTPGNCLGWNAHMLYGAHSTVAGTSDQAIALAGRGTAHERRKTSPVNAAPGSALPSKTVATKTDRNRMERTMTTNILGIVALLAATALTGPAASAQSAAFAPRSGALAPAQPALPASSAFPFQLVLDDNSFEATVGVAGNAARQFLWFNRFAAPNAILLDEVWVLFPAGQAIPVGGAIDLVVYSDNDANPANGATLLATIPSTVQVADGVSFSIYNLATPIAVPAGSDVFVGVINRFVQSGITPPTFPAAIDTSASRGRSWVAIWSGDPPASPVLPSNATTQLIDTLIPAVAGNWMIRAFGVYPPAIPAPSLDRVGLGLMAAVLLLMGFLAVGRSRPD